MAAIGLLVVLGLVVVVPALLAAVVLTLAGRRADDVVRAARRHDTLITLSTVLVALLVAVGVISLPVATTLLPDTAAPGTLLAVSPFAVAVAACVVRVAGEVTWPRPQGAVRTAPLRRRTVRDVSGWRLAVLLATALLLVVVLLVTGLTATDGTTVAAPERTVPGVGTVSGAAGPYPGWPYGLPMLVGLGVALACAVAALRVIVRRSPLGGLGATALVLAFLVAVGSVVAALWPVAARTRTEPATAPAPAGR